MKRAMVPTGGEGREALSADPPPTHNAKTCTCLRCDPLQSRTAKLRAKWDAERAGAAKLRAELAALPRVPAVRRLPPLQRPTGDNTRRFAELLKAGRTAAQAIDIIESENTKPKEQHADDTAE